jgi:hypothetical protein
VLGRIELAGWRLEHANWVYVETGQNSRNKFLSTGQQVVTTGQVMGIYLFRRDDEPGHRVAGGAVEPKRLVRALLAN